MGIVGVIEDNYRPSDEEPFMNERQKEYFRRKLIAWRESILAESRETLAALQNESENHPDIADRASSETDRAIELRARDRQRKLIAKIEAALTRIDDGSYGFCVETGDPISLRRLDARPIATLSVEAQERHERREQNLSRRIKAVSRRARAGAPFPLPAIPDRRRGRRPLACPSPRLRPEAAAQRRGVQAARRAAAAQRGRAGGATGGGGTAAGPSRGVGSGVARPRMAGGVPIGGGRPPRGGAAGRGGERPEAELRPAAKERPAAAAAEAQRAAAGRRAPAPAGRRAPDGRARAQARGGPAAAQPWPPRPARRAAAARGRAAAPDGRRRARRSWLDPA